jgi:hypothetical protein
MEVATAHRWAEEVLVMSSILLKQVWSHAALPAARSHSIMGVASCHYTSQHGSWNCSMMSSIIWELLIDEQYNNISRHGSRNCSMMSSIMKELLIVSSIILMSWHGSREWDFDLIQLKGEQYVLAGGVCWRLQEWILKVGLESQAARLQSSCTGVHSRTRQRSAMALTMNYANHTSDGD